MSILNEGMSTLLLTAQHKGFEFPSAPKICSGVLAYSSGRISFDNRTPFVGGFYHYRIDAPQGSEKGSPRLSIEQLIRTWEDDNQQLAARRLAILNLHDNFCRNGIESPDNDSPGPALESGTQFLEAFYLFSCIHYGLAVDQPPGFQRSLKHKSLPLPDGGATHQHTLFQKL